ncbi:conserved hypothetical protein [Clostridium carboxidivorans P7]|uniref:Uncharacterized protein n=1 Tax=Clostridium carboxidivorans P7 TaxID=536227 RepID=C6PRB9_9CLOT|nr:MULTISPECIES: hypothetical protein [Clostridium]EET88219.1 conserved hypothetical protein [Clostridium carboxidivorans P7]EFG87465.1 hypothetical protein CLCAR_2998 [Clostridium carboxidivorans P7]WPC43630.1 hypothetical protein Q6H37_09205 [Clostridium sp. JS66]
MDNNKSHMRTDDKSNAELRKMYPKDGEDIGIVQGEKLGSHSNGKKFTKRSKLSHNV